MHLLTISQGMHACFLETSPNQEEPESGDSQTEDSETSGSEGKRSWTKKEWEAYLTKLEKEVQDGRAPRDLLIRGWEICAQFSDKPSSARAFPDQPET